MPGMFDDLIPPSGGGGGGMFDDLIPKRQDSGNRTLLGLKTPQDLGQAPERPQGYWPTWQKMNEEAIGQMGRGIEQMTPTPHDKNTGMLQRFGNAVADPFRAAAGIGNVAAGAFNWGAAPVMAGVRNYVSNPVERATGIPSEEFETALGMGTPRGATTSPRLAARPAPDLAMRTAPERGSALSVPGTLQREPVVDMGELERSIAQPQQPAQGPVGPSAEVPEARPRESGARLIDPSVPHDLPPRGRASVGAGTEGSPLADYSPETVEAARDLLAQSGLDNPHQLEARLDEISPHHMFGEMSPALELETAGVNAADKGRARNLITQSVLERRREAPQRESALLDSVFGRAQNRADLRKAIEAERAKQATPLWQRFTQTPIPPTDQLRALLPRLDAAGALRAANRAMAEEGLPAEQGFALAGTNEAGQFATQIEHMPTAAAFQYAKEHVDGLIEKALAAPGEAKAARRYTNLSNALRDAIDNHPDQNVAGLWQAARQAWERPSQLLQAQKIGGRLLTNNIHREDLPGLLEGWDPERLQNLLIGVRGHLEDLLRANRNPTRTSSRVMDALLSEGAQEKLRAVLRPDQVERLITGMQHEESMHGAPQRIIGGSPTSERQAARNRYTAEGQGPIGKTLGKTAEFVKHPVRSTFAKGMEKAAEHFATKSERQMAQLRDELSRMFTTQGPERNAIARALVGAEEPGPGTWNRGAIPGGVGERPPFPAGAAPRPQPVYGGQGAGWRPISPQEEQSLRTAQRPATEPARAREPATAKGQSLLQFLASKGGLKRTGDLQHTLDKNPFISGHGRLFRNTGMTEEEAMTAAVEAGYLDTEAGIRGRGNIRDFHDAVREEAHGNKRYPIGSRRNEAVNTDEQRHAIEQAVLSYFDEIGQSPSSSMLRDRIVDLVEKEGLSPEVAHERAAIEEHNESEESRQGAQGRVPVASGEAPEGGLHRGNEGQRGPGKGTQTFGKAHTEEAKRWVGNHQKKLERDDDIPFRRGGRVRRADGGGTDSDGEVNLSPDAQALASSMTHYAPDPVSEDIGRRVRQTGQNLYNSWLGPAEQLGRAATSGTLDVTNPETAGAGLGLAGAVAGARMPFARAGEIGSAGGRPPIRFVPDVPPAKAVAKGTPANTNLTPTEQFIDEYDALVRKKAAELNREGFHAVPQEPPPPSITAYHGSPHDFDKFDISRIGAGEGAQAYGHGLYFAENEGVARDYRDSISPKNLEDDHAYALSALNTYRGDRNSAIQQLRESSASIRKQMARRDKPIPSWVADADRADRAAELLEKGWQPPAGKMYQVAIKADPEHFLDWDKPLSEQSKKVREALKGLGQSEGNKYLQRTGQTALQSLTTNLRGDHVKATEQLRSAGIPGIKYLDQGSRNRDVIDRDIVRVREMIASRKNRNDMAGIQDAEEQLSNLLAEKAKPVTHNFVVFDDKLIDIMKKYGLAGLVAAGAYHYQDKAQAQGRARGGRIIGAKSQSDVGLAQNETGTTFRCGTCKYFKKGICHNENPELKERKVKPHWCCNLYDHEGMEVIA